ncbi:MAG: hypothetical protein ACREFT_03855 [Acetobacteraceae bacterium]
MPLRRLRVEEKLGPAAIARRMGIGRASVYRILGRRQGVLGKEEPAHADPA